MLNPQIAITRACFTKVFAGCLHCGSAEDAENRFKTIASVSMNITSIGNNPGLRRSLLPRTKGELLIVGSPTEVSEEVLAYQEDFDTESMWFMSDG